jgi:hypothetical protein
MEANSNLISPEEGELKFTNYHVLIHLAVPARK